MKPAWHGVIFSLVAAVRSRYIANVNGARQALAIQMSAKQKPTQTIYAGVASLGTSVYRSQDGGATWTALPRQQQGRAIVHACLACLLPFAFR
jgi:hypothetical protein